jgi:hypothetical protein
MKFDFVGTEDRAAAEVFRQTGIAEKVYTVPDESGAAPSMESPEPDKGSGAAVSPSVESPEPDKGSGATVSPSVESLKRLENESYSYFEVDSKPQGKKWLLMVLDIARRIVEAPGLLEAITPEDLEQLTEDNYHTARHAAETVLNLKEYMI